MWKRCLFFVMLQVDRSQEIGRILLLCFCASLFIIHNLFVLMRILFMKLIYLSRICFAHFIVIDSTTSESGSRLQLLMLSWVYFWLTRKSSLFSLTHRASHLSHLHLQ